ncbi:hypothetical protein OUO_0003 [Helicobacter pylori R046Wa]|nr:hypothetical protein OUO_0003 [Helicobacter pylori R046Wa]
MAIWGIEIKPQHQRVIAETLRNIFIPLVRKIPSFRAQDASV